MNSRHFDLIVAGAGIAGLTAAAAASSRGLRVALVSTGPGSFVFGAGCVEVAALGAEPETMRESLDFFRELTVAAGCDFRGGVGETHLVPTILGSFQEVTMAPFYLWNGAPTASHHVAVVGIRGLSSFDSNFVAERLAHSAAAMGQGSTYVAHEITLPPLAGTTPGTLQYANRFDREGGFREELRRQLRPIADRANLIVLPGILGLKSGRKEIEWLEKELGCLLCELPTLPPSVPGMRLYNRLEAHLRRTGIEFYTGFPIERLEIRDHHCEGVVVQTPARSLRLSSETVVVATGPFPGALLGTADFGVDATLHPVDEAGRMLASNLLAAGTILRHGPGHGGNALAIATGYRAGQLAAKAGVQYA